MEGLREIPDEVKEDIMLALIERQTTQGSRIALANYEQRMQESIETGIMDEQRFRLYNLGQVALTAEESDIIFAARHPQETA